MQRESDNIGRLLVAEFQDSEINAFDEIMEVLSRYPEFQRYEVKYAPILSFPGLEIHTQQRKVFCGNQEIRSTQKEYALLLFLAKNRGRVMTYEQIYENVWGHYSSAAGSSIIGFHICKLREKLYAALPDRAFQIRCVRQVGYCFEAREK